MCQRGGQRTFGRSRVLAAVLASGLLVASCSGGGDSGATEPSSAARQTTPSTSTGSEGSEPTGPGVDTSPGTTAASTTTQPPPPEILPVGAYWEGSTATTLPGPATGSASHLLVIGDTVWLIGGRYNAPVAWRSGKGGGA